MKMSRTRYFRETKQTLFWANNRNTICSAFFPFKGETFFRRYITRGKWVPLFKLFSDKLTSLKRFFGQEIRKRSFKRPWRCSRLDQEHWCPEHRLGEQLPSGWLLGNFTPRLFHLKNITENKRHRDTFPITPCYFFSKAIKCPGFECKNEGESFCTWNKHTCAHSFLSCCVHLYLALQAVARWLSLLLINISFYVFSVCFDPALLTSIRHPDTMHFFPFRPQVYQTDTHSIAQSSPCTTNFPLPSPEHKPPSFKLRSAAAQAIHIPKGTAGSRTEFATPDFHAFLSFHTESRRGVRCLRDTGSRATMQCIIHLFLERRVWPSCPERVCVPHIRVGELLWGDWDMWYFKSETGKECVTCFLGMFHPNTIFIGKKSNWFRNIEENVSILHNGTVILNSHLELCALMDKRNRHPSTLKKFSCKSFWRVMLPSHYLTALHPDLPPPTFSSGINTTLLSFISSQNTLPSWRPPPSVPAAHASPTSTGTCTDMYTPVPTTAPYLCSREKRNPRHKISPLLSQQGIANKIFASTQTHKLSTLSSPPKGSYFTAFLHGTMSTRKPGNSQSSAQENSHLHSVTKSPKANTVPSDMQLVFRNKGRKGGKGTSHCQHWKFVRCFQNCISRWAKRPSATCMQLTGTPDLFPNVIPNSPCRLLCKISSVNPSFIWVRAKNHSVQGSLCPNKYQAIFTYASKLQFGKKKLIHPRALWSSDKSFPD